MSKNKCIPELSEMWFAHNREPITFSATSNEKIFKWIIEFNTKKVEKLKSILEVKKMLKDMPGHHRINRGLGRVGQISLETWGSDENILNDWFKTNKNISHYEIDHEIQTCLIPNDPSYSGMWALKNIQADLAWGISTGNKSVVVGVIDTGINYNHPDLKDNIWVNLKEIAKDGKDNDNNRFIDDIHGWDFADNTNDIIDVYGHGTHIAGTIGAVGNNGIGIVGINWNINLMGINNLNNFGFGDESNSIAALNYVIMMKKLGVNIKITSNSWLSTNNSVLSSTIKSLGDAGILFVCAAGNDHKNNDISPMYPSSFSHDNIIAVAASDINSNLASFSNYGVKNVDLAAPGVNILSTTSNGGYGQKSGTSMATPHVTVVAALLWSKYPNATIAQIKKSILNGVDKIPSLSGKVVSGGRLNAFKALNELEKMLN